jgi:glycosyltransferase involved in cell wall biosynthesis
MGADKLAEVVKMDHDAALEITDDCTMAGLTNAGLLMVGGQSLALQPVPRTARDSEAVVTVKPLSLTILTPSLNGATFFEQTLQSVMSQAGDVPFQWIVIDGGSSDNTVSLLRSIDDPRVQWISESDNGQAAAINKGLAMSEGDIVAWLNCDDLYLPGALAQVVAAFEANPLAQWIVGRCNIIDDSGQTIRQSITDYKNWLLRSFSMRSLLRTNMISQPAVFWRRSFGKKIGPLDESLRFAMDYDLWLRMARVCPPLILDHDLASFRVHNGSKSRGGHRQQFFEGYRVASRYFGPDKLSRVMHRINLEKIVWGYRTLRWLGR